MYPVGLVLIHYMYAVVQITHPYPLDMTDQSQLSKYTWQDKLLSL